MSNNLESISDEEIIAIYSSTYPLPLDMKSMKKLVKKDPELYKEMEKRRLFVNLRYIVPPQILKEYEKIQEQDKEREAEGRDSIIKKYDLTLDKFSKIMIERTTEAKIRTEQELKKDKIVKLVKEMAEKTFDGIHNLEEYKTLYTFQLVPLKRIIDNGEIDLNELSKTAKSLKELDNKKNYEVIEKFKSYMARVYNETKRLPNEA
jgi:hypothetical protein